MKNICFKRVVYFKKVLVFNVFFMVVTAVGNCLQAQTISDFLSVFPTGQTRGFVIPSTHGFQVLSYAGDTLKDGTISNINYDFTGYVPKAASSRNGFLSINHEYFPGGVDLYDLHYDSLQGFWVVDTSSQIDYSPVVSARNNCSGTVTPWGTIISCEETVFYSDLNGDGYGDHGWCTEIDPQTRAIIDHDGDGIPDKLWQQGRFVHENECIYFDHKTAYLGDDTYYNGYVYKFIADVPEKLAQGDLFVLQMINNTDGVWIKMNNKNKDSLNNMQGFAEYFNATTFRGVEDMEVGPDSLIYFASKYDGKVYRFRDFGDTIRNFETYVGGMNYTVNYAGGSVSIPWGLGNDNLAFDPQGNLWVCQDMLGKTDSNFVWVVYRDHSQANPHVELFATLPLGSEPTGITFSPDGEFIFMSIMHPETTNAVFQPDATGKQRKFNADAAIVIARKEHFLPKVSLLQSGSASICTGDSIGLAVNNLSHFKYQWFYNGNPITSDTASAMWAKLSGDYWCAITVESGTVNTDTFTVATLPIPSLALLNIAAGNEICPGDSVKLTLRADSIASINWFFNGMSIAHTDSTFFAKMPGNYHASVVFLNGCTNVTNTLTIDTFALPALQLWSAQSHICLGDSVSIAASNATSFNNLKWFKNGVLVSNGNTFMAKDSGNYTLIAQTLIGNCSTMTNALYLSQKTLPTATVNPIGNIKLCTANTARFTAMGGNSYVWKLNGVTVSTSAVFDASLEGIYTVAVSDGYCTNNIAAASISTVAAPIASINSTTITSICQGDTIKLQANVAPGLYYQWYKGGAEIFGASASYYSVLNTGTYTVKVSNAQGCFSRSNAMSIQVNPKPIVSINPSGNVSICPQSDLKLKANSNIAGTWSWARNAATVFTGADSLIARQTGVYTATLTTALGCSGSTPVVAISNFQVTQASITPLGSTSFCEGDSVLLNANTAAGNKYTWLKDGVLQDEASARFTAQSGSIIGLIVEDVNGCLSTAQQNITINTVPVVRLLSNGPAMVCTGNQVALEAQSNQSTQSYQWFFNGTPLANVNTATYSTAVQGFYKVKITSANGCSATTNTIQVTVNSNPVAVLSTSSAAICAGDTAFLRLRTGSGIDVSWYKNGIAFHTGDTLLPVTEAGMYTASASSGANCTTLSNAVSILVNAIPSIAILALDSDFCDGDSVLLSLQNSSVQNLSWYKNDVEISNASSGNFWAKTSGIYKLKGSNAAGCSNWSNAVTVLKHPIPTVNINYTGPSTVCNGDSVVLIASQSNYTAYSWLVNATPIVNANNTSYVAKQSGVYSLKVTDGFGCENTSSTVSIYVNPLPVASIKALGSTVFCSGDSVVLKTNFNQGYRIQWFKDNVLLSNFNDSTINVLQGGIYWSQLTNGAACSDTSNHVMVTTKATPIIELNVADTLHLCMGDTLILKTQNNGNWDYKWYNNTQLLPISADSIIVTTSGSYYAIASANNGCADTTKKVYVDLHALPAPVIVSSDTIYTCNNKTVVLNAIGAPLYQWKHNGNNVPLGNSAQLSVQDYGTYSVWAQNVFGCTAASNTVLLLPGQADSVNILATQNYICLGDTLNLQINPVKAGNTYIWQRNGSSITVNGAQLGVLQSGIYACTVTDSNWCVTTAPSLVISGKNKPLALIQAFGNTTVCNGDSVLLSANQGTGLSYTWYYNSGIITNYINNSYNAKVAGTYQVRVSNTDCSNFSNAIPVTVQAAPAVPVVSRNFNTLISTPEASYQWFLGANLIVGATAQSITLSTNGTYSVEVTNALNCSAKSLPFNFIYNNLQAVEAHITSKVVPNPSSGLVQFIWSNEWICSFEIANAEGKVLVSEVLASPDEIAVFDGTYLPSGLYFVTLKGKQATSKLLMNIQK